MLLTPVRLTSSLFILSLLLLMGVCFPPFTFMMLIVQSEGDFKLREKYLIHVRRFLFVRLHS